VSFEVAVMRVTEHPSKIQESGLAGTESVVYDGMNGQVTLLTARIELCLAFFVNRDTIN